MRFWVITLIFRNGRMAASSRLPGVLFDWWIRTSSPWLFERGTAGLGLFRNSKSSSRKPPPGHSTAGRKEKDEQSWHAPPGIPVTKSAPAIGAGVKKAPHRRGARGSPSREKRSEVAGANPRALSQSLRFTAHLGHAAGHKKSDNALKSSE
jgi:hypothetical protein